MSTVTGIGRAGPDLPRARGDLSSRVISALRGARAELPGERAITGADPYGEDLHLTLYVLYELHYRGFAAVPDRLEWDPELLRLRQRIEDHFLGALWSEPALSEGREPVPGGASTLEPSPDNVAEALLGLLVEPAEDDGRSVSHHLQRHGERWQMREYAAVRSLYHLKEADPHVWVIPRLWGRAKAAMAAIEFDEFGGGRAENVHAKLFADLMVDLDLNPAYGRYLESAPAEALATVNLMSLLGLHRGLRGALVGHFAWVEVTSSPGSRRLAGAMRRIGAGPAAQGFYEEHVAADAVHEQVVRREVIGGLLEEEPELEPDVVFGIRATGLLEERLGEHLLTSWRAGRSALAAPLDLPAADPGTPSPLRIQT